MADPTYLTVSFQHQTPAETKRLLTVFAAPLLFALIALWRIWQQPDQGEREEPADGPSTVVPLT